MRRAPRAPSHGSGGNVSFEREVIAVRNLADAVRKRSSGTGTKRDHVVEALVEVCENVHRVGNQIAREVLSAIQASKLEPVDPSDLRWNIFRLLDIAEEEVRWTQWLAGILRPENGQRLARLIWESLCDAVVAGGREPEDGGLEASLATLAVWHQAREEAPRDGHVYDEFVDEERPDLGRVDILVDAPTILVILENKLWSGWTEGPGRRPQADRYRDLGRLRVVRGQEQRLGLVLLSNRKHLVAGEHYPKDYILVTYYEFGKAIRKNLKDFLFHHRDESLLIDLWPAWLTLVSIEQDLLGIDYRYLKPENPVWQSLGDLSYIEKYMATR